MDSLINFKEELSVDQQRFMMAVTNSTRSLEDQHYEIGLPIKNPNLMLPNNIAQALQRASYLKKKLQKNDEFHRDFKKLVSDMIEQGYCEKVEFSGGRVELGIYLIMVSITLRNQVRSGWWIRVVFDCSAKFNGVSINDNLLQGPDLTNSLVGVLLRFRREEVAIQADIKSMFYQVRIPARD